MVINWNPRKAICFWRVCGEQQEHQFPNFIPWQIWITWDCLQLGWLRLFWITLPYPLFVFFGKVFPFTPHCWALVAPLLLYPLPSSTPQGVWGATGWAWGWDQPWASAMRWGEPSRPASVSAKTCLPWTPLQRTSPAPFWKQPCHPTLLCKSWPSRERLGLPSLAQALLLGQYPLQPIIATQNSLISFSIEVYFCTMNPYLVL